MVGRVTSSMEPCWYARLEVYIIKNYILSKQFNYLRSEMNNRTLLSGIALAALSYFFISFPAQAKGEVSYKKDIRPIIYDYCLSCHKPGGKGYKKSGLDLRTYKSMMKGTKYGAVIKPGDSYTSILIQSVEGRVHPSIRMPYGMDGSLAKDKIELLRKWVQQGAKDN